MKIEIDDECASTLVQAMLLQDYEIVKGQVEAALKKKKLSDLDRQVLGADMVYMNAFETLLSYYGVDV